MEKNMHGCKSIIMLHVQFHLLLKLSSLNFSALTSLSDLQWS